MDIETKIKNFFYENGAASWEALSGGDSHAVISDLIANNYLTAHFQPIFSSNEHAVFGYESLARLLPETTVKFDDIQNLFVMAKKANLISSLDMLCRRNSIIQAAKAGIRKSNANLFININPETIIDPVHIFGLTDRYIEESELSKERIIFEITECTAIHNYQLFSEAVEYYRKQGYRIAIDDFGVGYGGLKMLYEIKPDFIKIDRHFISDIHRDFVKQNLVDSIAMLCRKLGIDVIAEGIENRDELVLVNDMGIDLIQGYLLGKPSPELHHGKISAADHADSSTCAVIKETGIFRIGDLASGIPPIYRHEPAIEAYKRFMSAPDLSGIPVLDTETGIVFGMLHRHFFLMSRTHINNDCSTISNRFDSARDFLEHMPRTIDVSESIEGVLNMINNRNSRFRYGDLCVTSNGRYSGTISIHTVVQALRDRLAGKVTTGGRDRTFDT